MHFCFSNKYQHQWVISTTQLTIANFKTNFKTKELSHTDALLNQPLKYKLSEKSFVLYFRSGGKNY